MKIGDDGVSSFARRVARCVGGVLSKTNNGVARGKNWTRQRVEIDKESHS